MAITVEQVKNLRAQTGAGMMDCKKALIETNGDLEKAVEILRKKGLSGLAKRAGRTMKEGIVSSKVSTDGKTMSMVELNCETDFVARNPDVIAFANNLAQEMLGAADNTNPAADEDVKKHLQEVAIKIGENMQIRRGATYVTSSKSVVNCYIHSDNRKGAMVELEYDGDLNAAKEELMALAKEISMQAVAMSPKYLKRDEVPADIVANERDIYKAKMLKDEEEAKAKAEAHGKPYREKPADAIEKMLVGRVNKYYQEVCLLEQATIRDSKVTVTQSVENLAKKLGANINVKRYVCYIVGVE